MNRRGVALIAVLWVVTILGSVASAGLLAARDAVSAGRYRMDQRRARWEAEGCLALARRQVDRALQDGWSDPFSAIRAVGGCSLRVTDEVNDSTTTQGTVMVLWRRDILLEEAWVAVPPRIAIVGRTLR